MKTGIRTKTFLILFLVVSSSAFVFFAYTENTVMKTEAERKTELNIVPPQPQGNDKFLIGAMNSYWDLVGNKYHDSAGLNVTHSYLQGIGGVFPNDTGRFTPVSWVTGSEILTAPVPTNIIRDTIYRVYYEHNQTRLFWQRPKIEWLAYGQSSKYQCENILANDDYWFYAFHKHEGQSEPDWQWNSGDYVLHCSDATSGPEAKFVIKRLKANTEQSRRNVDLNPYSNQWQADSQCDWLIKPRIRIDSAFANNPANWNKPVCRIDIRNRLDTLIKSIDIKVRNFLVDTLGTYNGRYIEEFTYLAGDSTLTFHGDLAVGDNEAWWWRARGNNPTDVGVNKADIQVWWYDNCDMWIDYIKVENDVASNLLTTDTTNQTHQTYVKWIQDEVNAVKDYPNPNEPAVYNFYIELFEFNNIPCMAYVNKKIQLYSGGKIGLMADLLALYQSHLSWNDRGGSIVSPGKIKSMFYDSTNFPQVFIGDPYPLTADLL